MFRLSRGHLQAVIWNILGSIQIICRGEIKYLTGFRNKSGLYTYFDFKIKIEDWNYNIEIKLKLNYWKQLLNFSVFLKLAVVGSGILLVDITWFPDSTQCIINGVTVRIVWGYNTLYICIYFFYNSFPFSVVQSGLRKYLSSRLPYALLCSPITFHYHKPQYCIAITQKAAPPL